MVHCWRVWPWEQYGPRKARHRWSEQPRVPPNQPTPIVTSPYGVRSRFDTTERLAATLTPQQDLVGIITPSSLHYVTSHRHATPDIDPRQHRLLIHGMVNRPMIFTMEDLKRLPYVSRIHFLACAGNSYLSQGVRLHAETVQDTDGKTSCSEWTGVPLSLLLQEAGLQKGARWLLAEGAEMQKHSVSIPLAKGMDDALLAYAQNGEPVRPENGYPLRLLVPGFEGTRNVKWLRRIKVGDEPFMSKWDSAIYANLLPDGKARWFQFVLEPKSVITRPSGGQRLPRPGFYDITGLAWSGGGAIRRVEVSTDGGRTWKDAQLQEPVLRMAHTRFHFPWTWDGKEAVIQSRCTDDRGDVQPSLAELTKIWGVNKEYWRSSTSWIQHFNAIQPWKVTSEGSIHNAIWL